MLDIVDKNGKTIINCSDSGEEIVMIDNKAYKLSEVIKNKELKDKLSSHLDFINKK